MLKNILSILFLLLLVNIHAKNIPYNNSNIQWLGRWCEDPGNGNWSAWGGTQIVFKVHGTSSIVVNASVIDPDSLNLCILIVKIDNNPSQYFGYYFTSLEEIYSGDRSVKILLPDTSLRTIIIHTVGSNAALFNTKQKTIIKSFEIDSTGNFVKWSQGEKVLQAIGDSWMAAENDYPRFMNRDKWKLYPIATGGLTVTLMDSQYNYNYFNSLSSDPPMDAAILSFGVNDFFANISNNDFEKSLKSLLNKIQLKQPNKPVYLIQAPKNSFTNNDFGKYGESMNKISNQYPNVYYISTRSLESNLSWKSDNKHLSVESKLLFAKYIDSCISHIGISKLLISTDSLKLSSNENSKANFEITSNVSWNISCNKPWLTSNVSSGDNSAEVTLAANKNDSYNPRNAQVIISGEGINDTIFITQEANVRNDFGIRIYPNPIVNKMLISFDKPQESISILSLNGTLLYTSKIQLNPFEVNMYDYTSGLYIVRLVSSKGDVLVQRIIKL